MTMAARPSGEAVPSPRFTLTIEPVNLCNLACSYCLREDAHLHKDPAAYLSVDLLTRILREAKEVCGANDVSIAGGEPTLHPRFSELIGAIAAEGYTFGLVTNGWHFDRVRQALASHRRALRLIGFSLDGATEAQHDLVRGKGSFKRLMRGVADCLAQGFPFRFKVVLHRGNHLQTEALALFAARMGAVGITFAHLLPTSPKIEETMALSEAERLRAEGDVAILGRLLRSDVKFAVGFTNLNPDPPCRSLALLECNIDYTGRMGLCCNLSGFRGGAVNMDHIADLNETSFGDAWAKLGGMVELQNARRRQAIEGAGAQPSSRTTSPCELCLTHFEKTPWRGLSRPSKEIR